MAESRAGREEYLPGYKPSQVRHHAWRTAENSTAYLLPALHAMREANPKLQLLDVGAGPGSISASFAQHLPDGHVTATDLSDEVLSQAAEHARSVGVTNIAFQKADVYALPFSDASFDVTHAHQVLCHLDHPVAAIKEMVRVTRPGGFVALRESDLKMWCVWPELKGLLRYHEVLLNARGTGSDKAGRQLLSWALAAGVRRENVTATFGTWCYSQPGDRETWGDAMKQRIAHGGMRQRALDLKLATEEEMDEMAAAWDEWSVAPDATQGIMNGELLIRV